MHKEGVDFYCSDDGGITKVAIRIEAPTDSDSFTHKIYISGTKDPSLSIIISKIVSLQVDLISSFRLF